MTDRAFVDTNVWVYTVDRADPERRRRALAAVGPESAYELVVSTQVLTEFFAVVTRKLESPLPTAQARTLVAQMAQLPVVNVDESLVLDALEASDEWDVSIWDALIIRAAGRAGCPVLLSEDLTDGRAYGTVRVINPFREG